MNPITFFAVAAAVGAGALFAVMGYFGLDCYRAGA
jgi:hypothetical protein